MVSWQNTDYYRNLKQMELETGLTVAEYNRMNSCNQPSVGEAIAMAAPSIFLTVLSKIDANRNSTSSSSQASATAAAQIKGEIQAILDKYKEQGVTNISDLEAYLQTKYNETNTNIQTLEQNIQTNTITINEKTARNQEIDTRLGEIETKLGTGEDSIEAEIQNLELRISQSEHNGDTSTVQALETQIEALEAEKKKLEAEKKELEEEKEANSQAITTAQENITTDKATLTEFKNIQKDIDDLRALSEQLKQVEGRNAIEGLVNEDTGNITELIKQHNTAQAEDAPNKEEIKEKLKTALQEYVDNPANNNKTILTYADKYFGIKRAA